MKVTTPGKVLIVAFALGIVALGVAASRFQQPAPVVQYVTVGPVDTAAQARAEQAARDEARRSLTKSAADIEALDAEIAATEVALNVAREEADRRTFSRQDDRQRVGELNAHVAELKVKRAHAVRDYNTAIASVDSTVSAGLPSFQQRQ